MEEEEVAGVNLSAGPSPAPTASGSVQEGAGCPLWALPQSSLLPAPPALGSNLKNEIKPKQLIWHNPAIEIDYQGAFIAQKENHW